MKVTICCSPSTMTDKRLGSVALQTLRSPQQCLQSSFQIFPPNKSLSQTPYLTAFRWPIQILYTPSSSCSDTSGQTKKGVWLKVISDAAGAVWCLIWADRISRGVIAWCYLWADGPVEPYRRCLGDWRAAEALQERSLRVPTLFNCLQVCSSPQAELMSITLMCSRPGSANACF